MAAEDDPAAYDLDLEHLGVCGRWTPTPGEQRLCAITIRRSRPPGAHQGDQSGRWEALGDTFFAALAAIREAPPEDVGFDADGAMTSDPERPRLIDIVTAGRLSMADVEPRLRWADEPELRRECDRFESEIIELRRVMTTVAGDLADASVGAGDVGGRIAAPSALVRSAVDLLRGLSSTRFRSTVAVRPRSSHAQIVLDVNAAGGTADEARRAAVAVLDDIARASGGRRTTIDNAGNTGNLTVPAAIGRTADGFAFCAFNRTIDLSGLAGRPGLIRRVRRRFDRSRWDSAAWLPFYDRVADFAETGLDDTDVLSFKFSPGGGHSALGVAWQDVPTVMARLDVPAESRDENGERWGLTPTRPSLEMFVSDRPEHALTDPCFAACTTAYAQYRAAASPECVLADRRG